MVGQVLGGRYRLTKRIASGDVNRGLPELWHAQDAGDTYYARVWRRRNDDKTDVKALWNREVRVLSRLHGYPGATDLFVRLQDLNYDDMQYYAILDSGRRNLLSELLNARNRVVWLTNLSEISRRRPLWEGLLRIAEALAILHNEGTLHRSLSSASIFVGPEVGGDFRLSGFEWSVRIAGSEGAAASVVRTHLVVAPELEKLEREYSTTSDWFDFGLIAAELFGVHLKNVRKRDTVRQSVAALTYLRESERRLILKFLTEDAEQRLSNADEALQEIRQLLRDLATTTTSAGRNLIFTVRMGPEVNVSRAVENASRRAAKADQPLKQLKWIENDLRGDVRITARVIPYPHFVVRGEKLEYRVRPWRIQNSETWDIGYCESTEAMPRSAADDQHFSTGQRKLEVISYPDARKATQRIRDRSAPWDKVFTFARVKRSLDPSLRDVHDFFRITQHLDTALVAACICQVNVLDVNHDQSNTTIIVTPKEEPERTLLAQHLGLAPPSTQLKDWVDLGAEVVVGADDKDPKRDRYQLLDRRVVDSEGSPVEWYFIGAASDPNGPRYSFRCVGSIPVRHTTVYLAKNYGGAIAQIRRRHKAIEEMRSHEGLLRLLADPQSVSRRRHEPLPSGRTSIALDGSKLTALQNVWQTQPSFAIQGPPGTGKTTLIKAFVDRLLDSDPSAQILLTAHSHHTVDDVRMKISEMFQGLPDHEKPIVLRVGSREPTEHDIGPVTQSLIGFLKDSDLMQRSPQRLQNRLKSTFIGSNEASESADIDLRTMQLLIQDAANITFSTLNSPDLAELASRGRRFDWSILEEAGKAHGFDMSIALTESHRLLLIGDHFQLPPFNSKVFKKLLSDPLRVQKSIQAASIFAPTLIDTNIVLDDENGGSFGERCDRWRTMVDFFGNFFKMSIGEDADSDGPASTLTDQHRMHPDIADLVGKVFYPNGKDKTILVSPEHTHEKFKEELPFVIQSDSWLPDNRIVWCDVPWKQRIEDSEGETDGVFESLPEVDAVIRILEEIKPKNNSNCDIQILSPYNDQLEAIRDAVNGEKFEGNLSVMFEPPFDLRVRKRLGATVDEFQGGEADIVLVSLVRNNPLVPWKSVGFLKEINRMNVLLSRARHKLIIIGSWDFFNTRCDEFTSEDEEHAYIGTLMDQAEKARKSGRLARVSAPK